MQLNGRLRARFAFTEYAVTRSRGAKPFAGLKKQICLRNLALNEKITTRENITSAKKKKASWTPNQNFTQRVKTETRCRNGKYQS